MPPSLRVAFAALLALPAATDAADSTASVAIVGGGVSGMHAAMTLESGGLADWVIVEREGRLGGRVKSVDFAGKKVDLGAQWIQGINKNPFYEATRKYKVASEAVNYNNLVVYDPAREGCVAEGDLNWNRFEQAWACVQGEGDRLNAAYLEDGTFPPNPPDAREVFLQCGWDPADSDRPWLDEAIEWFDLEYEYGRRAEEISIHAFPEYTYVDFQDADRIATDGLQKFIDGVLDEFLPLGEADPRVRLNTLVRQIVTEVDASECVRLGLEAGCIEVKLDGGDSVFAQRVISTLPFPVIRNGQAPQSAKNRLFPNGIPGDAVLDKFQMGHYCKTYFQFDVVFWDLVQFIIYAAEDEPTVIYRPADTGHPNKWTPGSHVITGTLGGPDCLDFDNDPEAFKEFHMAILRNIYGDDVPEPLDYMINGWDDEDSPTGGGSWFQYGPDATFDDYRTLVDSGHPNLYISGEHSCDRHYGFVHGGMISGMRDGNRVLEALGMEHAEETRCELPPDNQGTGDLPRSKKFKA